MVVNCRLTVASFRSRWHRGAREGPHVLCFDLSSLPKVALGEWNADHFLFSVLFLSRCQCFGASGLSLVRKCPKPLNTSVLPNCRPAGMPALLVSLLQRSTGHSDPQLGGMPQSWLSVPGHRPMLTALS